MKAFWQRLNDRRTPLGKAWRTFYQFFIPVFLVSLGGFFTQVYEWAVCISDCAGRELPDPSVLGKALVAATFGGLGAIVTYFQNSREDHKAEAEGRTIIDAEPVPTASESIRPADSPVVAEGRTASNESVPVVLTPGEAVVTQEAADRIGREVLGQMGGVAPESVHVSDAPGVEEPEDDDHGLTEDDLDLELTDPVPLDTVHDGMAPQPPMAWQVSHAHDDPERFEGVDVIVLDEPEEA